MEKQTLEPIFNKESEILILGSSPSVMSLKEGFYYTNKGNQFWKLLANSFNDSIPESKKEKIEFLYKHRIAVWDVCEKCKRNGSSDTNLKCLKTNNIKDLVEKTKIKHIYCNGKKAYELYKKNLSECIKIDYSYVLSSSGAANSFSKERSKQWGEIAIIQKKSINQ